MDQSLYNFLKRLECSTQGAVFDLPSEGSEGYKALNIEIGERWKLGSLIDNLIWLRDKAQKAAVRVYMEGKE